MHDHNIDILLSLKDDIINGSTELTDSEDKTTQFTAAIDAAIKDVQRMNFIDCHGLDWDGLGVYIESVGTFSGENLREALDKAMATWREKESR